MRFDVWAPAASRVELVADERRHAMSAGEHGWWSVTLPDGAVRRYGFALDGGEPLPDPRSPSQPDGVHGLSEPVDHKRFPWTDAGWSSPALASGVIYELHVGTFSATGTFDGVVEHLDHLVDLGVTHVELMPVCEFAGERGWGYDGVDLYAPHHAYGGPDGLKRLVNACHRHGLAVILDVVYNHLGPAGNYLGRFGPYFTDRYKTPWGSAVNFDGPGSDEVRRFFCDNALGWLRDYHVDGLRLDAVHAIVDTSALSFLEQLASEVADLEASLGRALVVTAESDLNDARLVRPPEVGGFGLHAQWNDDFHHALHTILTNERQGYYEDFGRLEDLARALTRGFVYEGQFSPFRGRRHGRPATGISGDRFVAFAQNHDQIGNRACGERSGQLMSPERLKIAAALVLTSPFVPLLFQGEEWGASSPFQYFVDHEDEALARAVREGRRQEFAAFGWRPEDVPDPQAVETFERSRLDWREHDKNDHADLLAWHRQLIALRRQTRDLTNGRLARGAVEHSESGRWLTMRRGRFVVACNLAAHPQRVPVRLPAYATVRLASTPSVMLHADGIGLPAESVAIVEGE